MADNSNVSNVMHLEILQKQNSLLSEDAIVTSVEKWLSSQDPNLLEDIITKFDDAKLSENVLSINIERNCDNPAEGSFYKLNHHVYRFNSSIPEIQNAEGEEQQVSTQWILPTEDFHGLWESLIYDGEIKQELLNYVSTALHFSEKLVDPNIISWNRIVLLHGPPGTGKTSLCKALAQKVCIRYSSKFRYGHFVEVNTHSLFSKWFSESGKLVTKMFHEIINIVEDPQVLVIVLLDELPDEEEAAMKLMQYFGIVHEKFFEHLHSKKLNVHCNTKRHLSRLEDNPTNSILSGVFLNKVESLARSRASALNGNEPSDALRVVNALLTHLDMIKRYSNVLILTTSNITEAIDVALVDRADIKQYVGLPSQEAIYQIYCSCIKELQKTEIIITGEYRHSNWLQNSRKTTNGHETRTAKLKNIAEKSSGLSGRSLRKIPFIACSLYLKTPLITVDDFLDALDKAIDKHWKDVKSLKIHI